MKALFLNKFMFYGIEVYRYLDIDTNDFVWLEGGRDGKEMRRIPPPKITYRPQGQAVDIVPDVFSYVKKNYMPPLDPYNDAHIHWAF